MQKGTPWSGRALSALVGYQAWALRLALRFVLRATVLALATAFLATRVVLAAADVRALSALRPPALRLALRRRVVLGAGRSPVNRRVTASSSSLTRWASRLYRFAAIECSLR